jgi:hypothetical protein
MWFNLELLSRDVLRLLQLQDVIFVECFQWKHFLINKRKYITQYNLSFNRVTESLDNSAERLNFCLRDTRKKYFDSFFFYP